MDAQNLWKMVLNTSGQNAFRFCKEKSILGFGWPLEKGTQPKTMDDYLLMAKAIYPKDRGLVVSTNAFSNMKIDDLIWTRSNGIYYICRVIGGWKYSNNEDNFKADIPNTIACEFVEIGSIENVPGKVINAFRARSTVQRIWGESKEANTALEMSKMLYNRIKKTKFYDIKPIQKENFLSLLLPEDVEEIIFLYLQLKYGYLLYSSSNKIDTQTYEGVMINPLTYKKCYIQVKTGNVALDGNSYVELTNNGDEFYLFTTSEIYTNLSANVKAISKQEILDFVNDNLAILPDRIKIWNEEVN